MALGKAHHIVPGRGKFDAVDALAETVEALEFGRIAVRRHRLVDLFAIEDLGAKRGEVVRRPGAALAGQRFVKRAIRAWPASSSAVTTRVSLPPYSLTVTARSGHTARLTA